MKDRYLKLLVFIKGINRPYLLTDSNMGLYSIISGDFYEGEKKIGKVIAFNVKDRIPVKLGEQPCTELKCSCCPLGFCCEHNKDWSDTPFDILKMKIKRNDNISKKVYKQLHKELSKKYETNH